MPRTFNGSSDYIRSNSAVVTDYPFTVAAWVRVNGTATSNSVWGVFNESDPDPRKYNWIVISTSNVPFASSRYDTATTGNAAATGSLTTGQWSIIIATFESTTSRKIEFDGGNEGTDTTSVTSPSAFLETTNVGRNDSLLAAGDPDGRYMDGDVGPVCVWNVALNADEKAAISKGVSFSRIRPGSIIHHIPLWGNHSPEIDLSGNNYNMSVTGAVKAGESPPHQMFSRLTTGETQNIVAFKPFLAGNFTLVQGIPGVAHA